MVQAGDAIAKRRRTLPPISEAFGLAAAARIVDNRAGWL
jgi:hypothetical protein